MLREVVEAGFQYKNGAAFARGDTLHRVRLPREVLGGLGQPPTRCSARTFDKVLADAAARMGAEIRYRHEVTAVDLEGERPTLEVRDADGQVYEVERPLRAGRLRLLRGCCRGC